MSAPRVSVAMSVYNGEAYLEEALWSIRGQTFGDFEFLIVDDGSTDGSAEILRTHAAADRRLRIITQANAGLGEALNRAIAAARGEYVARMDADDVSRPGRLAAQVAYLDAHQGCAFAGTGYVVIDGAGRPCGGCQPADRPRRLRERILSSTGNPVCHGSVMLRAAALRSLRPVYRLRYSQDFDLWVRLLTEWDAGMVSSPLYLYREHGAGVHGRSDLTARRLAQRRVVLALWREGRLFDEEALRRAVAALSAGTPPPAGALPAVTGRERELLALFFQGDFSALRATCRRIRADGGRSRQLWCLRSLAALPVRLAHRAYDCLVRLESLRAPLQRRLLVAEVLGQHQFRPGPLS